MIALNDGKPCRVSRHSHHVIQIIEPEQIKPSVGLFYDRNNSLLWSVIINDAGNSRFRLNVYPSGRRWFNHTGWFLSIDDEHMFAAGLSLNMPVGIGLSAH